MKQKKSAINQIITIAIIVLIMSIILGVTFLFVDELKTQVREQAENTYTTTNETSAYINTTGYTLASASSDSLARTFTITAIWNASDNGVGYYNLSIPTTNASVSSAGSVTNASAFNWGNVSITYTYESAIGETSYLAVNDTEDSGTTLVDYLPPIFLALVFSIILAVVLKIIVPYINFGKEVTTQF